MCIINFRNLVALISSKEEPLFFLCCLFGFDWDLLVVLELDVMATNKKRIEHLDAVLGSLQDNFSTTQAGHG